jgi:hypothetical protein
MNWLVSVSRQTRVCGPRSGLAPKREDVVCLQDGFTPLLDTMRDIRARDVEQSVVSINNDLELAGLVVPIARRSQEGRGGI